MDQRQKDLLLKIMELEFTAVDLNLFLDTHPQDERALSDLRATTQQLVNAKMEYESNYGPLLDFGLGMAGSGRTWQWINEPWPWEINWRRGA